MTWENRDQPVLARTWQGTGRVNSESAGTAGVREAHARSKQETRTCLKANIRILYNSLKGGVDYFGQLCATNPSDGPSKKWQQATWPVLIAVALLNGCVCYNTQNPDNKPSQRRVRGKVREGLLDGFSRKGGNQRGCRLSAPEESRPTARARFPGRRSQGKAASWLRVQHDALSVQTRAKAVADAN